MAALLPPFDPRGAGAAGRHLGPSDPLWWQSRGLCEPVSQGRASPKFLVTPKWHRQPCALSVVTGGSDFISRSP